MVVKAVYTVSSLSNVFPPRKLSSSDRFNSNGTGEFRFWPTATYFLSCLSSTCGCWSATLFEYTTHLSWGACVAEWNFSEIICTTSRVHGSFPCPTFEAQKCALGHGSSQRFEKSPRIYAVRWHNLTACRLLRSRFACGLQKISSQTQRLSGTE